MSKTDAIRLFEVAEAILKAIEDDGGVTKVTEELRTKDGQCVLRDELNEAVAFLHRLGYVERVGK